MSEELIEILEQLISKSEKLSFQEIFEKPSNNCTFFEACLKSKKKTIPYVLSSESENFLFIPGGENRMNTVLVIDVSQGIMGYANPEKSIRLVCDGLQVEPSKRIQVNVNGEIGTFYRDTDFDVRSPYGKELFAVVKLFLEELITQENITKDYNLAKSAGEI